MAGEQPHPRGALQRGDCSAGPSVGTCPVTPRLPGPPSTSRPNGRCQSWPRRDGATRTNRSPLAASGAPLPGRRQAPGSAPQKRHRPHAAASTRPVVAWQLAQQASTEALPPRRLVRSQLAKDLISRLRGRLTDRCRPGKRGRLGGRRRLADYRRLGDHCLSDGSADLARAARLTGLGSGALPQGGGGARMLQGGTGG